MRKNRVSIGFDKYAHEKNTDVLYPQKKTHMGFKIAIYVSSVLALIIGAILLFSYLKDKQEQQRKEYLAWRAMYEMTILQSDKTVNYLRLHKIEYENNQLLLEYLVQIPGKEQHQLNDSTIRSLFYSYMAINPESWDSVFCYLKEAEVNLKLLCVNHKFVPSIVIPYDQLPSITSNKQAIDKWLGMFTILKSKEIFEYAKQHFKGDRYLFIDSVSMTDDYVELNFSFDDSKYRMGDAFLDTTHINRHFTDKVGDMGSILDGIFSICLRTDRGFAFIYKGKKNHIVHRCEWNKERTRELYKEYPGLIMLHGRKTNQVKTIIYK